MSFEFQVKKTDLPTFRVVERPEAPLQSGQIRLNIDRFAFTANNITYGVAGDSLGYWQFFPPAQNSDDVWGLIPVWGFADVVASECDGIEIGERLYGYFPPATSVVLQPVDISSRTLTDGIQHRAKLPPLYNRYTRVLADPAYDRKSDAARILLAPLHLTSFCLWDQLKENHWYGAEQVVIISASSKTSLGLAYGLSTTDGVPETIGLTSQRNVDFVTDTQLYNRVVEYGAIAEALPDRPTVIVDMAGNASVKQALESQLGANLAYYISVGVTHWEALTAPGGFDAGAASSKQENFFAPSYILQRFKDWGPAGFEARSSQFVMGAALATFGWVKPNINAGLAGLEAIYPSICAGTASASIGHIVKL